MSLKESIQTALDAMKKGVLNITEQMQSSERVKSIHVRKERLYEKRDCTSGNSTIIINGSYKYRSSKCININVEGDVQTVDTQGDVTCQNVTGDISTQGDVTCKDVGNSISTQGDVTCRDIGRGISTMGDINCHNVNGPITTMGDVTIKNGN